MQALKINKQIDSEILYLPEFRNLIGKNVEIIILAEDDQNLISGIRPVRKPGSAKGMITVADDFQAPLDDELTEEFYK
ncbi:MAG: hypothetical protein BWK80_11025 [Desulfobacteraceae bacterium IS3]|nr:MAG: hypothetical protein BWK80_11025 [Desulfobacteraceae bacterium IS3]